MGKAEKLKKICKKVWNLIIPIIIISAIIGAILVIPKYYNKGGGAIETAELTLPSLQNWEILAAKIAGGFFIPILILVLILYSRMKSKSGSGKPQISCGKVWNWVIAIVIISAIIGAVLIVPKYYKKDGSGIRITKSSALYSWKKLAHQYGYNPNQRSAGPFKAKITKHTDSNLSFIVYGPKGEGYFDGWEVSVGKYEGRWRCPQENTGGEWELQENPKKPGMFKGLEKDSDIPDGKPLELIILD